MSRLLIGVTGGIAAYKALETARLAMQAGYAVRVVQTPRSLRFVGADAFQAITGAPVLLDEFEPDPLRGAYPGERADPPTHTPISHLALAQRADAYLIAPASANTIAKLAAGLADTLLTTAALAADCPVLIAPAMNDRMYRHPATQANLKTLAARGVTIVGPEEGALASRGEAGLGRMSEPSELLAAVQRVLAPPSGPWRGRRVLVTAGGTREPIDAVRYVGNRSSGRMGYALAARAAARGAEVTLVAANVSLPDPAGVRIVPVLTAVDLAAACESAFASCDVLFMAAAVADFRPRQAAGHKLRKADGVPALELEPTPDVLAGLASRRHPRQLLVGFAAEHGPGGEISAQDKLARKRLDAVVLNDVAAPGIGFDAEANEVTIFTADGAVTRLARADKSQIADNLLDEIARRFLADPPPSIRSEHREEGHVRRADGDRAAGV